jgi:hypothetical protein
MALPFKKPTQLDLLNALRDAYGPAIRLEINSLKIFHSDGATQLQIMESLPSTADPDETQNLCRIFNLKFISLFEKPSESIFDDARKFIEDFGALGIYNTLPILTIEAESLLSKLNQIEAPKGQNISKNGNTL